MLIFLRKTPPLYTLSILYNCWGKKVGRAVSNCNHLTHLSDYLRFCPIFELFTIKQIFDFDPYRKNQ